jgi:arsenite methyltransferase
LKTNSFDQGKPTEAFEQVDAGKYTGLLEVAGDTLRPGGIELTKHALGFCDFSEGSRILDAGCGTATTARHLGQTRKLKAFGVDRSATLLAEGRGRCRELPLVRATLECLPFRDSSLDGVVCECVLSQTRALEVLLEFRRILRGRGFLILSDLYRRTGGASPLVETKADHQLESRAHLAALLGESDFEILHWEDRTSDLKKLAVRLILSQGSSPENLLSWTRRGGFSKGEEKCMDGADIGYYVLVGRRTER